MFTTIVATKWRGTKSKKPLNDLTKITKIKAVILKITAFLQQFYEM